MWIQTVQRVGRYAYRTVWVRVTKPEPSKRKSK